MLQVVRKSDSLGAEGPRSRFARAIYRRQNNKATIGVSSDTPWAEGQANWSVNECIIHTQKTSAKADKEDWGTGKGTTLELRIILTIELSMELVIELFA